MEYLYKVLGIKATVQRAEFDHLPNYIAVRYRLQKVSMDGQKVIFLYPKTELEQIEVLKKHIARIQKKENLPVVLVLNELSYRQKEYLLREKIPFIVDGKQIYLPFMSVYLQERCDAEKQPREDLLPSAQLLLLHFIYGGTKELPSSQAAKDLKLTATSISRASILRPISQLFLSKSGICAVPGGDRGQKRQHGLQLLLRSARFFPFYETPPRAGSGRYGDQGY